MKQLLLTFLLAATGFGLFAQKLDKAKDLLKNNKLADAKTEIDNYLNIDKNQATGEPWFYKGKIYLAISNDANLKTTVPDARNTAFESFKKYMELESKEKDAAKRNLLMTLEGNQPLIDIYTNYSKEAASYYNAGNFNDALEGFKHCLVVYDYMAEKNIIPNKFDTTTTLYAGIAAEKAKKRDDAAIYYGKIADAKAKGEGFVEIYKWLADYYRQKGDVATSQKYTGLGRELYPGDTFWTGFDIETAREKGTKEELFAKYEQAIKESPDNHLYFFNYGVELYQAAYDTSLTKRPANSEELIQRATEKLKRCIEMKPDYANSYMVLGQIYYNKGVDLNNQIKAIRPAAGAKLTAEQAQKKEDLRKEVMTNFDAAIPNFDKVDQLLSAQGKLKMEDKEILKNALDLLITIYEEKTSQVEQKKNQAETKKNVAEAKTLDAELKKIQEKSQAYTVKFNDVDRKH